MKKQITVILSILLLIVAVFFIILNMGEAEINFGFAIVKMPLILVLLGVFFLGALIMFLLSTISTIKSGTQHRRVNKKNDAKIADLNRQIQALQSDLEKASEKQPNSDKQDK